MLRHLLTSGARTSSRSLLIKPNASVYVSSLLSLSDQRESMLRHIYTLAARKSSRSLFAKPNARLYVSSLRSFSDQKESTGQKPVSEACTSHEPVDATTMNETSTNEKEPFGRAHFAEMTVYCLLAGVMMKIVYDVIIYFTSGGLLPREWKLGEHECHPQLEISGPDPVDAAARCNKVPDSFDGVKVTFNFSRPIYRKWFHREGTEALFSACINVRLPNFSRNSDFEEMHNRLKRRGINVECSENGLRRGLTEYALQYMQSAVNMHLQKYCGKCDLSFAPIDAAHGPIDFWESVFQESLKRNLKVCHTNSDHPKLNTSDTEQVNASGQSIKKPDPFEGVQVSFEINRPRFSNWLGRWGTDTFIAACVNVILPNFKDSTDYREICDGLKRHGIDVKCTEAGLRRGVFEYALKHMNDGINKHFEKKCTNCDYFNAPSEAPPI